MPFKTAESKRRYHREWSRKNRDRVSEYVKVWKARNPERTRKYLRDCHARHKQKAFELLGNRCANVGCRWVNVDGSLGCIDYEMLQVDHIHGGGNRERLSGVRTVDIYRKIQAGSTAYQLLCANCNWKKKHAEK